MTYSENTSLKLVIVAFALLLAGAANASADGSLTTSPLQPHAAVQETVKKMKGVVVKREPDSFTMSETTGGPQTTVILTASTEVKSHKRGVFRGSKEYGASYILRGLRLEVDGVRNADGSIVAEKIRFDEQDLRTAQALKATVDPVEALAQFPRPILQYASSGVGVRRLGSPFEIAAGCVIGTSIDGARQ